MAVEPGNNQLFLAYHIRSAFLTFELQLREIVTEWSVTPEQFYVLRCDWAGDETALDEIIAHTMFPKNEAIQALDELVARACIKQEAKEGLYSLTPQGVSLRAEILEAYHAQISSVTQGLSRETIEATLSCLLTVQNNIQHL